MRKVLPISLILTVALLGCSLNRTPGNGQPVSATPSMSPATTPGTSYGNTPMSSSYAAPATSNVSRADHAAAIMREHQSYQPRFLGYLNPEPRMQQTAQSYDNGQQMANPELTVNSSISSGPYPVITGGTDAVVLSGTTGTSAATVAPSTVAGTTTTPTTGTTAATLTPTLTSGATVSPNVASSALPSMASASGVTTTTTPTATSAVSTTSAARLGTTRLTLPTSSQAVTAPLSVTTKPGGQIMITNVKR